MCRFSFGKNILSKTMTFSQVPDASFVMLLMQAARGDLPRNKKTGSRQPHPCPEPVFYFTQDNLGY